MNYDGMITTNMMAMNMATATTSIGVWVSIGIVDGVLKRVYGREADACHSDAVPYISSFTSSLELHQKDMIWWGLQVCFEFLILRLARWPSQVVSGKIYVSSTCKKLSVLRARGALVWFQYCYLS